MRWLDAWKQRANTLKREVYVVFLAMRDSRTPWYAKALAVCVVGYAFSPIDLIPDVIPILGLLDDLILVPLGIALVIRLIPPAVLAECRELATATHQRKVVGWAPARIAMLLIIALWALVALAGGIWIARRLGG